MIRRLRLENYRAFEKVDIPLTKVNLFFGPNSSGKSAILSAIKDPIPSAVLKELTLPTHRNQIERDFILRHANNFLDPVIMKSANCHHT